MSRSTVIAPAALALLVAASPVWSASVSSTVSQKASARCNVSTSGCTNNPGPYITINGELELGGVKAKIILTNNAKFTHVAAADVVADVDLIPEGDKLVFAKQPSRGGVGGNPWIYLQFNDCKGKDYTKPILLGRCVQGLSTGKADFDLPTGARMNVSGGECSNSPGPYITLDGEMKLGGLGAKLILTNNAKFTHAASADVVIDIVLIEDGKSLTFHKQPSCGGAGGNPWIYVQFCDGKGDAFGSPILVGRCNKL